MQEDLEASVQIGQVLANKYRVDRILGVGGMGVVVAATHMQLDQLVALKFIRREALMNAEVISRFEREARAAVRLKSEHVARILDVGRLESGSPYIVMEYLEGQDLGALLQQQGTISVPVASDFIIQACDAIAEAHSLGIVHRDLKPGNLFLATASHGRETVKVLDFGISKTSQLGRDVNATRTQVVMGSPGYMSPEQMRSAKNVDGRTDIWALGVILYELVSGRVPFHADSFTALCLKVAMDPLPPLRPLSAALPTGFEAVVQRALEKDPAHRYASAVELARALAPFASVMYRDRAYQLVSLAAGGLADGAHMMPTLSAPPSSPTTLGAAAAETGRSPAMMRGLRWRMLLGGGVVAVAVLGLALAILRRPVETSVTETPASLAPRPAAPPMPTGTAVDSVAPGAATPPPPPVAPKSLAVAPPTDAGVTPDSGPADSARAKPSDYTHSKQSLDPYSSPD